VGTVTALFSSACGDPVDVDRLEGREVDAEEANTHVAADIVVGALLEPMTTPSALEVGLAPDDELATFGGADGAGSWFKKDAQAWHDLFEAIAACDAMTTERPPWYVKPHEWQFLGRMEFVAVGEDPADVVEASFTAFDDEATDPEGDLDDLPLLQQWKLAQADRPILVDLESGLAFRSRIDPFPLRDLDITALSSELVDEEQEDEEAEAFGAAEDGGDTSEPAIVTPGEALDTLTGAGDGAADTRRSTTARLADGSIGHAEPRAVYGEDGRLYVEDPGTLPWRRVAQVRQVLNDRVEPIGYCSAAMAGPRHAWSAAHCFISRSGKLLSSSAIVPAANGQGLTLAEFPYGSFRVRYVLFSSEYQVTDSVRTDWAIAILRDTRGYDKWFGSKAASKKRLKNKTHRVSGYPSNVSINFNFIPCDDTPLLAGFCGDYQYYQDAKVRRVYSTTLRSKHDATKGQSGSALVRMSPNGNSGSTRGVLNKGFGPWTRYRRLTSWNISTLCRAYDDYPSSDFEVSCE
jgi:V8-like Glu-specific endopeptidase